MAAQANYGKGCINPAMIKRPAFFHRNFHIRSLKNRPESYGQGSKHLTHLEFLSFFIEDTFMLLLTVHLTLLYDLYIYLEMSSTMKFFCFFALKRCSITNLAWLPEWQLWATHEICINPRWPPDGILEN